MISICVSGRFSRFFALPLVRIPSPKLHSCCGEKRNEKVSEGKFRGAGHTESRADVDSEPYRALALTPAHGGVPEEGILCDLGGWTYRAFHFGLK